jgi:Fe-S cluster assembly protein SufB
MEWVDANLGSKVTMKYPSCYLRGEGAHGEMLSVALPDLVRFRTLVQRWCILLPTPAAKLLPSPSHVVTGRLLTEVW